MKRRPKDIKADIESLDNEIAITKFAKAVDKIDKPLMKMFKKDMLTVGIIFSTTAIFVTLILSGITWSMPVFAGLVGSFGIYTIFSNAIKDRKIDKSIHKKIESGEITSEDLANNFDEIMLSEELGVDFKFDYDSEEAFDFEKNYTEDFKEFLKENKEEKTNNPRLKLVGANYDLTIDEVKEKLVKELDVYYNAYKIPPLTISNKEWDIIIEELYDSFKKKGKQKYFADYMSLFLRRVLVNGIIDKPKNIGYIEFVNGLDSILDINVFDGIFNKKDISNIKKKLLLNYKKTRVIDLNEYRKSIEKTRK